MKSKIRITGNRTVIGIICIVLALGITFGIAPLVNRFTDRKVEVVQVKQNVERGHLITEDDVELVKVGALNLSDRTVKNRKYVVGKYAATNLYAGQIMIADLVAEKSNSADDVLSALDGTKVAISVNIASFAQGLSNKLQNGDIVSVIVYGFRVLSERCAWYIACTPWNAMKPFAIYAYDRTKLMTALAKEVGLPEACHGVTPYSGERMRIRYGDNSFESFPQYGQNREGNKQYAAEQNKTLKVTKAQQAAMEGGVIYGWDTPAADPRNYDESGYFRTDAEWAKEKRK